MQPSMPFGDVIAVVSQRIGEARGLPWSGWTLRPGEATYSATRDGQLPHSVGGWLGTCISFLAVFALGAMVAYAARRFLPKRPTSELDVLMNQSAAFYGRWPEPRLSDAPHNEMMAEANRCHRLIDLLQQRAAASKAESEFLQGPIAGVQAWLALLHEVMDVPARA